MSSTVPNEALLAHRARSTGSAAAAAARHVDHWFYIGVGLFAILISVAGFGPSFVDTSLRRGVADAACRRPRRTRARVAAALRCAGIPRRDTAHARSSASGTRGAVFAAAIIGVSVIASVETTRRGHDLSGDVARAAGGSLTPDGILFPLVSLFNFGVLLAAALWYRRRPEVHKRLMLFALLQPLVAEPITHLYGHMAGHWPAMQGVFNFVIIPVTLLVLSVSAIHDRVVQRRIHPVSLWIPIALLVWTNVMFAVVLPSNGWLRTARWLIGVDA